MISIDNGERYCGGSLIKKDRVLTTQKCCIGAETFSIFIGGIDEPRRPIGKSTKCKNHDSSNIDDGVCVIHLDAPVSGERFTTIRLPSSSQCSETFEGNKATITAWSRTLNDDPSDTRLIHTDVIVNEKKVCKWANPELSTEGTMCTRDTKEPDDCGGYAGDPLTITDTDGEETQIGIASFGPHTKADCYREIGSPDGFVRITSYQYLINIWSD
ncbi:Hypothetical predicted protein [Cloeon dipterum]|uniref:Peptidase S1 domain-containing protein n=1 Tax=Cloeon dipterum TaxID=197152 RepID=A0A8S1E323_9INSE|nr:Hypothetical predicted protein [Cloeon dipterum]